MALKAPRPYQSGGTPVDQGPAPYPGSSYFNPTTVDDPFSGSYKGQLGETSVDIEVDLDQLREFSPTLNIISGTISDKGKPQKLWTGDSTAAYFRSQNDVKVTEAGGKHNVKAAVAVTLSGGGSIGGELTGTFQKSRNEWKGKIELSFDGKTCDFKIARSSLFFRDVHLDIDYTEQVIWPIVELFRLPSKPGGMENRKLDAFSAFEDAGIKLHYNEQEGNKVEDPTPGSPWTKGDLYSIMLDHFDEVEDADSNIWCMMGTTPPDKRYMGFSFDRDGKHGFGLFTGHSTFKGYDSQDHKVRSLANRRLLHYLVHECGHCLGLEHPFEKGKPNSLSWMNYAWKYDESHYAGSFYKMFEYRFSDQELIILRHAPGKEFKAAAKADVARNATQSAYGSVELPPDEKAADDSDDSDGESDEEASSYGGSYTKKSTGEKPNRKLELKLNIRNNTYKKGQLVDYEVKLKNMGKLPALIDSDLSAEGGNLQLYVSDPSGTVQPLDSYARPIKSSYTKPRVLYTAEDDEGPDRYSDMGTMGEGKNGYVFNKPGRYTIKAKYSAGRYNVTSDTYTIEIEEPETDDEHDDETAAQVSEMVQLGGSSHERFKKAQAFFENLSKKPVEKKKGHVASMIALFEGLSKPSTRAPAYTGDKKEKKTRKLVETKPARSPEYLLKDTDDLIEYYHDKGEKDDNHAYAKLVMVRANLYLKENRPEAAETEINRMYGDLINRKVKYDVLTDLDKKWQRTKNPKPAEEKTTPAYYQSKVSKVLEWYPKKRAYGEKDISGLGLGKPFSNFDDSHKEKAGAITDMLFNKYEETQDVAAVLKYANGLQQSREANDMVLKYSVESFIVHNSTARKVGIRYPEPPPLPPMKDSLASKAAMVDFVRKGVPNEEWMSYWRNDADFNYHHRHWHAVYNGRNPGPHLIRRGELFGYMHSQMLARYDAERESWGLNPVRPFTFGEEAQPYSAGLEFHSDPRNAYYSVRKAGKLDRDTVKTFEACELAYRARRKMSKEDANWAGGVLESCVRDGEIGSLHNEGHGRFSGFVARGARGYSYMGSTETAVRDPIFFRWHKRIDNLWQENNDKILARMKDVAAQVTIKSSDIAITSSPKPNWQEYGKKDSVETLKTYLKEPKLLFEHDDKVGHEAFFYHFRFREYEPGRVTIRIFICPERHADDRRRWIEMDKFVHMFSDGRGTVEITRKDKESSVIKRTPEMYADAVEAPFADTVTGYCECGWPYSMLLPRGTRAGEKYLLCVVVTDGRMDHVATRTTCGSMSYCGAAEMPYPDLMQMGYPFTSTLEGTSNGKRLRDVLSSQPNVALKEFVIQNQPSWREVASPLSADADLADAYAKSAILWPRKESQDIIPTDNAYRLSKWTGVFRIVLHAEDISGNAANSAVKVVFRGRGKGGGTYIVRSAEIAARVGKSNNTDPSRRKKILVKGMPEFFVPEEGITSDITGLRIDNSRDYFVTFVLDAPGCYLIPGDRRMHGFVVKDGKSYNGDWGQMEVQYGHRARQRRSVYCVQNIIA